MSNENLKEYINKKSVVKNHLLVEGWLSCGCMAVVLNYSTEPAKQLHH